MLITVKKNLIIFHEISQWEQIRQRLAKEFGASMLISWRMKRELGFTVREHQAWMETKRSDLVHSVARFYPEMQIHLDFFDSQAQSWFLLRYLDAKSAVDQ